MMLIFTGALVALLIVLVVMLMLTPKRRPRENNSALQIIKDQIEDEIVSETVPYSTKDKKKVLPTV